MKKTVVLGATTNSTRYAFIAANLLDSYGHEVVPVGIQKGELVGREIVDLRQKPNIEGVDTITLYIGTQNLTEWIDYIVGLQPKRIIFNPGTENFDLKAKAEEKGIETVFGCTLVMLRVGNY